MNIECLFDLGNGLIYCQYCVTPAVTVFICYLLTFLTVSIKPLECTEPSAQHDIVL